MSKTGNVCINITFRRVSLTIVAMEKQYYLFWVCVCSLSYPACNTHVPHFVVISCLSVCLCQFFFSHYLLNAMIFGKKVIEHKMCVLILLTAFIWSISHSKKDWARYYYKRTCVHVKYTFSCRILLKLELIDKLLKNTQLPNLIKILLVGAELSHADGQTGDRQTDGHTHDEINNRSSQFWQKMHTLFRKPWKKDSLRDNNVTHWGRVTQICVFTLQLCRTGDADLRF